MHLFANDLSGASICNKSTGVCNDNPGGGLGGLGERCYSASDCIDGTSCWQAALLGLPGLNSPVFVVAYANPTPSNRLSGCPAGHVCQAGFTFGHGNPWIPICKIPTGSSFMTQPLLAKRVVSVSLVAQTPLDVAQIRIFSAVRLMVTFFRVLGTTCHCVCSPVCERATK